MGKIIVPRRVYLLRHVAVQAEKVDVGPDFEIILLLFVLLLIFFVTALLDRVFLGQNRRQQRRHVVNHVLSCAKNQHFALIRHLQPDKSAFFFPCFAISIFKI
jgi:hypothetical protein